MDNWRFVAFLRPEKPNSSPQKLGVYSQPNYVLPLGQPFALDNSVKSFVKQEAVGEPIRQTIERHEPMHYH